MRTLWLTSGIILWVIGILILVVVLGGVFLRKTEISSVHNLWGPMIFHGICMALGAGAIGKARKMGKAVGSKPSSTEDVARNSDAGGGV